MALFCSVCPLSLLKSRPHSLSSEKCSPSPYPSDRSAEYSFANKTRPQYDFTFVTKPIACCLFQWAFIIESHRHSLLQMRFCIKFITYNKTLKFSISFIKVKMLLSNSYYIKAGEEWNQIFSKVFLFISDHSVLSEGYQHRCAGREKGLYSILKAWEVPAGLSLLFSTVKVNKHFTWCCFAEQLWKYSSLKRGQSEGLGVNSRRC